VKISNFFIFAPLPALHQAHGRYVTNHGAVTSHKQYNPADFEKEIKHEDGASRRKRKTTMDEATSILFTLVILRTGMQLNVASVLFDLSASTAGRVFVTWLCLLHSVHFPMIRMPTWKEVVDGCPSSVRDQGMGEVAVMIDCTEFTTERMWLKDAAHYIFSTYKQRPTAKFVVGITTSGAFCYVSGGYGGRMTDNAVVRKSGILEVLREQKYPKGAEVLADKGFQGLERDLVKIGMYLSTPPCSRGRLGETRFSKEDAEFATEAANVRIHVERAIGGLKEWKYVVQPVAWDGLDLIETAVQLCAALTNALRPPFCDSLDRVA
jgi:hypothetical protein